MRARKRAIPLFEALELKMKPGVKFLIKALGRTSMIQEGLVNQERKSAASINALANLFCPSAPDNSQETQTVKVRVTDRPDLPELHIRKTDNNISSGHYSFGTGTANEELGFWCGNYEGSPNLLVDTNGQGPTPLASLLPEQRLAMITFIDLTSRGFFSAANRSRIEVVPAVGVPVI